LGTGDVRKARDDGQDSCGGSASPKTMRNKSPKAQNIVYGRVAADTRNSAPLTHFFANLEASIHLSEGVNPQMVNFRSIASASAKRQLRG